MTNTIPSTRLGLQQNDTDNKEIFLTLFGGEILSAFEEMRWMKNLTFEKTLSRGKAARFPVLGRVTGVRHTVGENLLVPDVNTAGVNAAKLKQFAKTYHDIELDDTPLLAPASLPEIDYIMSEDGSSERQKMAMELAQALEIMYELTWLSTLVQCAGHTNDLDDGGTPASLTHQKEAAAGKAGFTDTTNNSYGYTIDPLTTGAAVRAALFKVQRYANFLRWPRTGRFAILGPVHYSMLCEEAGIYTGASGAVKPVMEFNRDIAGGGGGSISDVVVPRIAGFDIYECPWLTGTATAGLGTALETYFTASPSTADEKKYQPTGLSAANMPLYKFQQTVQSTIQYTPGGGGTQPDTWAEFKNLLDKVGIICGHQSCIGTVKGAELGFETEWRMEVQAWPMIAKYWFGHGILRPEAAAYVATAQVTT